MDHVLALDIGTTSIKAVLVGQDGSVAGSSAREYRLLTPAPDIVELDPEEYWSAAVAAVAAVVAKSGVRPEGIRSVGVTSQGETLIVVGKDGRPLRNAIVWLDNRAGEQSRAIAERFGPERVYAVTGQQEICPTWTAAKLMWVRDRQPELFARLGKALLVADYVLYRLTGRFVSEHGMNPSTLYYDLPGAAWWEEMLAFIGIGPDRLPELVRADRDVLPIAPSAARELGLSPRTAVTAAPLDQVSAAVGAGNVAPGVITEMTGAALAICATVDRPVYDPGRAVPLYTHGVRGRYVLMPWCATAGMALKWHRDTWCPGAAYDQLIVEAADVPIGCGGLMFLPHLAGAGCPQTNPAARGVFWGVTLHCTRGHFTRAILESIAFLLNHNLRFLAAMGIDAAEVRALGGGARSDSWMQIKADMTNKPIRRMACDESAAMGVAILSFVARGVYANATEAANAMVRTDRLTIPRLEGVEAYRSVYQRYTLLDSRTRELFGII